MDVVEKIKSNKAYGKYKVLVKKWEKAFTAKNSRLPSKLDIKEAPSRVRYAYKQYFQMKSAALEESLLDFTLDDESAIGSPEFPPLPDSEADVHSPRSEFIFDNLPTTHQIVELLSSANKAPEVTQPSNNNPVSINNKESKLAVELSSNLSRKLFQNSKFSLRNPRKSMARLSQTKSLDLSTIHSQNGDIDSAGNDNKAAMSQPDSTHNLIGTCDPGIHTYGISTLEINVSSAEKHITTPFGNRENVCKNPVRQLNAAWLERASGEKLVASTEHNLNNGDKSTVSNNHTKYGLTNLCVSSVDKNFDDVDEYGNSESDAEDYAQSQSLKPALKKRKLEPILENVLTEKNFSSKNKQKIRSRKLQNNFENETTKTELASPKPHANLSESKRTKRKSKPIKKNSILKNNKDNSEEDLGAPPNIEDFIPIGVENDLIPRFTKESSVFAVTSSDHEIDMDTAKQLKQPSSAADKLEKKIKSGTLNENFVKINIQKKVFVRGKKSFNYSKFKKKQYKDKKSLAYEIEFPESGKFACFKCGKHGHMARYCTAHRGDSLLPLEACPIDEKPTLADMETKTEIQMEDCTKIETISQFASSAIPESFLELLSQTPQTQNLQQFAQIQPVCVNEISQETMAEVQEALNMFGHKSFRPGQEETVMRILQGQSTLLILSTGSGKSLCYQLPAYIYAKHYKCVTLVISPLVSLMDDQVLGMPEFLRAGCLHTNQTPNQRQNIMQLLKDGELNILLISPEALISGDKSSGIGSLFKNLPPIAFACIDEAHCVSQWSHNFRPSYLMICKVLREKLKVKCILGLTATASQPTIASIIEHINVPDGPSGVVKNPALPPNLVLSVSYERDKDRSLTTILGSEPFSSYDSVIVYCIRRDECERVAAMLRSSLQEPGKITTERGKKRKRMSFLAEAYHAGLSAAQRRKIQDHFMKGSLKIIVATVAFGMGINKSDIRCIIHYSMPKSFESYVQEVGRAGRDGKPAHCHAFMSHSSNDKNELLKHIHADSIDRHIIRKLLQKVFVSCECKNNFAKAGCSENRCKGHEVAFPIEETVEELDVASENISTLLCYLELHPKKYIHVLNHCYTMCKIFSYGGPQKLLEAAKSCPPLAMAYTLSAKSDKNITSSSLVEFPVIDVAAAIGWESGITKYHLKNLEWTKVNEMPKRSGLKVEFHTLGLRVRSPGDLSPAEMDEMLDILHNRVVSQEKTMLYQLEEINNAFQKVAKRTITELFSTECSLLDEQSNELKNIITEYFEREEVINDDIELPPRPLDEERAIQDIRALISTYKDCSFTGRAIARILQGIPSPNYPAIVWGRCKFWRSRMHEDFHGLARLATQQLIDMRF